MCDFPVVRRAPRNIRTRHSSVLRSGNTSLSKPRRNVCRAGLHPYEKKETSSSHFVFLQELALLHRTKIFHIAAYIANWSENAVDAKIVLVETLHRDATELELARSHRRLARLREQLIPLHGILSR